MRRMFGLGLAVILAAIGMNATQQTPLVAQDHDGIITGTVTSSDGREAGVWVIAETDELETVFRKIVVTDSDGQFLLPELPAATYEVWVRGYGLIDSDQTNPKGYLDFSGDQRIYSSHFHNP